jgi:hypothetical protein
MSAHQHSLACIVIEGRMKPRCQVTGELVGQWWKKPLMWYGKQAECQHGLKVFLVNGNYIRNQIDSDFVQGTGYNSKFIPKGEMWIDSSMPQDEWPHLVLHECCQAEKIKEGWPLDKAYAHAKRVEDKARSGR